MRTQKLLADSANFTASIDSDRDVAAFSALLLELQEGTNFLGVHNRSPTSFGKVKVAHSDLIRRRKDLKWYKTTGKKIEI